MTQTTQELSEASAFVKLPTDANELLKDILTHRGWDMRSGQVSMVDAINTGLQTRDGNVIDIAVNAPVGTGKTLAYIVAALALGKRIIIATSTKSLQDQIVGDELPELADDLMKVYGYKLNYSVLKGMTNYPCVTAINRALNPATTGDDEEEGLFDDLDFGDIDLHRDVLNRFLQMTEDARKDPELLQKMLLESEALLDGIPLEQRSKYTAGSRCFSKKKGYRTVDEIMDESISPHDALVRSIHEPHVCLYRSAYANCINSQIVVVNTSLLVAEIRKGDMPGRETLDPLPSILSGAGVVVIDEAHHAARIISDAYSQNIQFDAIYKEVRAIGKRIKKDTKLPDNPYTDLIPAIEQVEDIMIDAIDHEETEEGLQQKLKACFMQLKELCLNASQITRNEWAGKNDIEKKTFATITKFNDTYVTGNSPIANFASLVGATNREGVHVNHLGFKGGDDKMGLEVDSVPIDVSWFRSKITNETEPANFYLEGTPLSHPEIPAAVVLSSGTITAQTATSIGVKAASFLNVESPFDSNKVRMFVPMSIPLPNKDREGWYLEAGRIAVQSIRKVGGRTLMLTTSNDATNRFTEMFRLAFEDDGIHVMRQGEGSKRQLISQFKEDESSVLVATMGFWEGVDVPGQALSQVIMDKIPFPMQSPVIAARKQFFKDRGENDFIKVDVDMAAIMLAQGAGRVIRSVKDIGGCMVLDGRIKHPTYGSKVTGLLPKDWWLTTDQDAYFEWLEWVNPETRRGEMPIANPEVYQTVGRPARRKRGRINA